jgi:hypothetical protein
MSAADATLANKLMMLSPRGHFASGWSFNETSIAIIAPT